MAVIENDLKMLKTTGKLPEMYEKLGINVSYEKPVVDEPTDEEIKQYAEDKYFAKIHKYENKVLSNLNGGFMPKKKEAERAKRSLLEYCKLDTLAMVRVWEKLRKAVE